MTYDSGLVVIPNNSIQLRILFNIKKCFKKTKNLYEICNKFSALIRLTKIY